MQDWHTSSTLSSMPQSGGSCEARGAPDVKVGAAAEVLQAQEAVGLRLLHAGKDGRLAQHRARGVHLAQLHQLQHHLGRSRASVLGLGLGLALHQLQHHLDGSHSLALPMCMGCCQSSRLLLSRKPHGVAGCCRTNW